MLDKKSNAYVVLFSSYLSYFKRDLSTLFKKRGRLEMLSGFLVALVISRNMKLKAWHWSLGVKETNHI